MPQGSDKPIRSIKDNPAGKVVADGDGNRWEWGTDDETGRLLKRLSNDDLAIERTDLHPTVSPRGAKARTTTAEPTQPKRQLKPSRDPGGGFNPYDHAGKPRRR